MSYVDTMPFGSPLAIFRVKNPLGVVVLLRLEITDGVAD